jgi:predicted nucleic acid-binding protein
LSWYVDSSVILASVFEEPNSIELSSVLKDHPVTSRLSSVEVLRAVTKFNDLLLPRAQHLLTQFSFVDVSNTILNRAESYSSEITVKASDAIHLATAETISPLIDGVITLDKQMAKNADRLGLKVLSNS